MMYSVHHSGTQGVKIRESSFNTTRGDEDIETRSLKF